LAINATLYKSKGFTTGGLIPIAMPAVAPEALLASLNSKIKSLRDLPTAAKSQKLYLATPGIGSGSQIAESYFFQKLAKLPVTQIPFGGGGPAMQGVLSGDANLLAATAAAQIVSDVKSKQVVGLAVASAQRDPTIPNVPTFAEQGYPDFLASSWVGFFAPKGTSPAIVSKLNSAINDIMHEPSVKKTFDRLGAEITIRSVPDTKSAFDADVNRWSTMVKSIGLSL
jgi:tripartite-type tricarboxylate transporter receptor subunit TctC